MLLINLIFILRIVSVNLSSKAEATKNCCLIAGLGVKIITHPEKLKETKIRGALQFVRQK